MVMAFGGNVNHAEVCAMLEDAGWAALENPVDGDQPQPPPPVVAGGERFIERESHQSHLVFGSTTIPMADPTRPAFLVVSTLFGGGMSSRLFQRVREELGLAYTVYAYQSLNSDVGVHGVYVGTGPETVEQARQAVADELDRLVQHGVSEEELETGRQQMLGQYILSLESPGARMQRIATAELYGEPFRTVEEVTRRIESVTTDDALAVARAWFSPERQSVVILGPGNGTPRSSN
jgi:predicted Zn-dependent peptidase